MSNRPDKAKSKLFKCKQLGHNGCTCKSRTAAYFVDIVDEELVDTNNNPYFKSIKIPQMF